MRVVPSSRGGSGTVVVAFFGAGATPGATPFPVFKLTLRARHRAPNRTRPQAVDEQQIEPRREAGVSCNRARDPASAFQEGT